MDGGAWWNTGVTESDTTKQLTNHCTCHFQDYFSFFPLLIQTWHSALVFGLPLLVRLSSVCPLLHFHFHALEKEMATHSSVLAWRIPGTGEPGGLLSMESHSRTRLKQLSSSSSSSCLLGLTCSVMLGRGKGIADTARVGSVLCGWSL